CLAAALKCLRRVHLDPNARYLFLLFQKLRRNLALRSHERRFLRQRLPNLHDHASRQAGLLVPAAGVLGVILEGYSFAKQLLRREALSRFHDEPRFSNKIETSGTSL